MSDINSPAKAAEDLIRNYLASARNDAERRHQMVTTGLNAYGARTLNDVPEQFKMLAATHILHLDQMDTARIAAELRAADASTSMNVPGYEPLRATLELAYDQSARGKGKTRHANARAFDQQPIMEIGRMVGPGYQTGQIMKKAQEATTMASRGQYTTALAELLGVIVYAAAAHITIAENAAKDESDT